MPGAHWLDSLAKWMSSRFRERPCSKNKMGSDEGRHLDQPMPHTRAVYTHVCAHACTHMSPSSTLRIPNLTQEDLKPLKNTCDMPYYSHFSVENVHSYPQDPRIKTTAPS